MGNNEQAPQEREILTWQDFGDGMREIAQQIADSGWWPDLIIAVARGGLLPAGALSYAMGIKAIGSINVEFYTDIAETLPAPVLVPPLMDPAILEGKKVLVVDDVADSGKTLEMVMRMLKEDGIPTQPGEPNIKVAEARSTCIYLKSRSIIVPDYYLKHTDLWINFPWSSLPVIGPSEGLAH